MYFRSLITLIAISIIPLGLQADLTTPESPSAILQGLTYYNPLNGTLTPTLAQGCKIENLNNPEFTACNNQKALVTRVNEPLKIAALKNFNYGEGTVAFWTRPDWLAKPGKGERLFAGVNFQLWYNSQQKTLFFMTGDDRPPVGFDWDYTVATRKVSTWKPEQWHHIAITWDAATGNKKLFLDGAVIASGTTRSIRPVDFNPPDALLLGEAHGGYRQFAIWNRQLDTSEIQALAQNSSGSVSQLSNVKTAPSPSASTNVPLKFQIYKPSAEKSVIAPGETYNAVCQVENPGQSQYSGNIRFDLIDFFGTVKAAQTVPVNCAAGESKNLTISFPTTKEKGIFKIAVVMGQGTNDVLRKDIASFAVWPQPVAQPDPDSFFGDHINSWSSQFLDQAVRLGQGWVRNHNMLQATWWIKVQPEPGAFVWTESDRLVDAHLARGIQILGQLFSVPYWADANGKAVKFNGYPPPILPQLGPWENYVYETVKHYKGKIKYWEVMNEPEVGIFWAGSPEEFARTVQVACQAAKRADPNCIVMVGGFTTPAWKWHEAAARAGAFKYADAISVHCGNNSAPPEISRKELTALMEHFNRLSTQFEPHKKLPLWSTEGGSPYGSWLDGYEVKDQGEQRITPKEWQKSAIRTVQGEALLLEKGFVKHFTYIQNEGNAVSMHEGNTLDFNNAPTPKLMARRAMAAMIDGTRFAATLSRPEGRFQASLFAGKNGGSVALLWAGDNGVLQLNTNQFPAGTKLRDIMTNEQPLPPKLTLTSMPVYLQSPGPAEQLRAALETPEIKVIKSPDEIKSNVSGELKPNLPVLPNFVAPTENPARIFTIDLRPYCNMGFADEKAGDAQGGWSDEGRFNDMRDMPLGKQTWYGVPFTILDPAQNDGKSVIVLKGPTSRTMPEKVVIKVPPRKCRALYFLHAMAWARNGEAGKYVIHYADSTTQTIPINVPVNCNNWWLGHEKTEISHPVPIKVTNTIDGKPAYRYLRVFEVQTKSWDAVIDSIEFISNGNQTPILIAITGV